MILSEKLTGAQGLRFLDIGGSAGLESKWHGLVSQIHYYCFEPNEKEALRLAQEKNGFLSACYIPKAVAGTVGKAPIVKTNAPWCWSLLEPNTDWLRRLAHGAQFEVEGRGEVETTTLDQCESLQGVDIDFVKSDTQGLEIPIFHAGSQVLESAVALETENGFTDNYLEESTFDQLSQFLREKYFMLFDLDIHRVPRANILNGKAGLLEQPIWAEAIWIKDYVAMEKVGSMQITPDKAWRILYLCAFLRAWDYGLELAELFFKKGLISGDEKQKLSMLESWQLMILFYRGINPSEIENLSKYLRFLPKKWRITLENNAKKLAMASKHAVSNPHIFKG